MWVNVLCDGQMTCICPMCTGMGSTRPCDDIKQVKRMNGWTHTTPWRQGKGDVNCSSLNGHWMLGPKVTEASWIFSLEHRSRNSFCIYFVYLWNKYVPWDVVKLSRWYRFPMYGGYNPHCCGPSLNPAGLPLLLVISSLFPHFLSFYSSSKDLKKPRKYF